MMTEFCWRALIAPVVLLCCALAGAQSQKQEPMSMPMPQNPPAAQATSSPVGQGLTLAELERIALANNPTLRQTESQIRAAAGRTRQAGLYPNPTVGYIGEQIRGGSFRGGEQGFFISQPIVLGGKLGLSRKLSQYDQHTAELGQQQQRVQVLTGVRIAFYHALAAQQMLETRKRLRQLADDAVTTTRQFFNVGQADTPDVLQAEVEAQQQQLAVGAAEQSYATAWTILAATAGKPDMPPGPLQGDLEQIPSEDPQQWMQALLRDSPAVKIAEAEVQRAQAEVARQRRQAIPDLNLRGGLEQNRELLGTVPDRPVGLQGFASVGVQLPIFNRNQGNVEAARADLERAQQEVERVTLVLRQRSAAVLQNYITSRAAAEVCKNQILPRAQQAYEMYLKNYHAMAAAYPQVLIAQRTLFESQTSYISALENVWTSSLTLRGFLLTNGLGAQATPGMSRGPSNLLSLQE